MSIDLLGTSMSLTTTELIVAIHEAQQENARQQAHIHQLIAELVRRNQSAAIDTS